MRPSQLIAVALSLLTTAVLAQQPSLPDVPGLSLDDNPPCAIPCLLAALNQTHCPLNDQPCLCADADYINTVEGCVALSCPLKYALQTQNITWTSCNFPLSNEAPKYKATRIALFIVLPTLAMILRITTKFARISTWGWDDYTIIAAYAILVGFFGMHFFLEANGAGRDLWTLNEDQITNFFKGFYAFQTLYHSCIDIIKASILFMYLRIFHLPDEKIRIVLWITQGVNLANGLIFIFLGLFQCTPVSLVWTFWTGEATGKCLPIAKLGLAHVCINIGLDVWMLILPATQIFRMNMAKRKKFAVMFMFGLGLFLTILP
ncbi:hypothetical protein Cob_v011780 [Colletotrichum orbiculare MAFF 240422]|uniref:CFEM domain-containing protein n=1 Tax=Colletotrichum orbiculare (strain 104-T / ATCC 96160 / CBS 514.97 / LARS 414 / MAFF 240422) TaxID=1213857 RepID=A0A484FBC4_COLOR|nr:hypothetical protein Cob_v011780 [Colletotrichum orbiculare MAFF 240422]